MMTPTQRRTLNTLRSNLRAQREQLALHQWLHGQPKATRAGGGARDESAWINDWQNKIAATIERIAAVKS